MKEKLELIKERALKEIKEAVDGTQLDNIRVKYLGKKGELTQILRGMGALSAEERPVIGEVANQVRELLQNNIEDAFDLVKKSTREIKLKNEVIDITMPGVKQTMGKRHPLELTLAKMTDIFLSMGYTIEEGPEVELDYYNFQALNIPKDHPVRGEQDTFYINDSVVLRTHTSPVQVRTMEKQEPPIKVVYHGKCYRSDELDASHSPIFNQIEIMVIDKGITLADLKGTLNLWAKKMFGEDVVTRFRPHHFPFTEPSCELDAQCFVCGGKGCKLCKGSGWIELLGGGMVHPYVLRSGGVDPEVYSGFAFGAGLDRIVMMSYGLDDIRLLYESDMRFLNQF